MADVSNPSSSGREALGERLAYLRAIGDYRAARQVARDEVQRLDGAGAPVAELVDALLEHARQEDAFGEYPTAEAALERAAKLALAADDGGRAAIALARRAALLRSLTRVEEAVPFIASALDRIDAFSKDSAGRVEILAEAAAVHVTHGDLTEARRLVDAALVAAEGLTDGTEANWSVGRALSAACSLERADGRYHAARAIALRAIADAERSFGPESLEVAYALNELGVLGKFSGQFEEASSSYQRALRILVRAVGQEQSDVASIYHNLGGLAHARGDLVSAEQPARRAVEIRQRALGQDHPVTALDRGALASILDGLGRHEEAEALLRSAVETLERTLGRDNHEVAAQLNNIAAIVQRRGDLAQAEHLYREALAIKERVLGPDSPEIAPTLNNLATVLRRLGRLGEAREHYERALNLLEGTLEPNHPTLVRTRRNMERLLTEVGLPGSPDTSSDDPGSAH